jgi:hypothetical protein
MVLHNYTPETSKKRKANVLLDLHFARFFGNIFMCPKGAKER